MNSSSAAWNRTAAALAAIAGVWVATASRPITGTAQSGITITSPAANTVLASGPDYATEVVGDPWDFSNAEDITMDPDLKTGWSSLAVSNGVLTGTAAVSSTNVFLVQWPMWVINNPGRNGRNYPAD